MYDQKFHLNFLKNFLQCFRYDKQNKGPPDKIKIVGFLKQILSKQMRNHIIQLSFLMQSENFRKQLEAILTLNQK